jgi:Leucine-rich repeat (LRR) protein
MIQRMMLSSLTNQTNLNLFYVAINKLSLIPAVIIGKPRIVSKLVPSRNTENFQDQSNLKTLQCY